MNKTVKSSLYFLSTVLFFIIAFIIPSILIPVPDKLKEIMTFKQEEMKLFLPLLLLFAVYISISYRLLIKYNYQKKISLFLKLVVANLIIFPLMGFLESIFWIDALNDFKGIEKGELAALFYPFIFTFILFSGYLALISNNQKTKPLPLKTNENCAQLSIKLICVGIKYFIIYNLAGYFIAWQFESTRIFYSGSEEMTGFIQSMMSNLASPKFVLIHSFRGILFGIATYLLYSVLKGSKIRKMIILALVSGSFGFQIILPNPLFPEIVRLSHFLETTSSMLIFGFAAGYIYEIRFKLPKILTSTASNGKKY